MWRVNLFPNPRMRSTGRMPDYSNDCKLSFPNDGFMHIKPDDGSIGGGYVDFDISGLTPGKTIVLDSTTLDATSYRNNRQAALISVIGNAENLLVASGNVQHAVIRCTVPDNGVIRIQWCGDKANEVRVGSVLLEYADTYDAAVNAGGGTPIPFNGDTMPKVG